MKLSTASGPQIVNKRSHYAKWLMGWSQGGGWTGWRTLECAYAHACEIKPPDCSWRALGYLMATEQAVGKKKGHSEE